MAVYRQLERLRPTFSFFGENPPRGRPIGCESSEEGSPFRQDNAGEAIPFWEQLLWIVGPATALARTETAIAPNPRYVTLRENLSDSRLTARLPH